MIDLGILHFFLGLQVLPLLNGHFLSQSKYVLDLLNHFKTDEYNSCVTPFQSGVMLTKVCQSSKVNDILYRQLVGSLIYLTHNKPNISFVVSVVSQFMQDP